MITHYMYEIMRKMVNNPSAFEFSDLGVRKIISYENLKVMDAYYTMSGRGRKVYYDNLYPLNDKQVRRLWLMKDYCDAMKIRSL